MRNLPCGSSRAAAAGKSRSVMPEKGQVSRREFLRKAGQAAAGAGVVAGFPTIIPGRAWGADGTPPSEQIRVGFIGVKNRGMQNLAPLMKHAVAVCDVDKN